MCVVLLFWLPVFDIPNQESDRHHSNLSPSIIFHIYHLIARCKVHVRHSLDEKKIFYLCFQYPATVTPEKLCTRNDLDMTETSIADFTTCFYITEIKKLDFQLPHVHILGNNHCGNTHTLLIVLRSLCTIRLSPPLSTPPPGLPSTPPTNPDTTVPTTALSLLDLASTLPPDTGP